MWDSTTFLPRANFQGSVHFFLGVEIIQSKVSYFIYCTMVNATPHALPSPPPSAFREQYGFSPSVSLFPCVFLLLAHSQREEEEEEEWNLEPNSFLPTSRAFIHRKPL